MASIIFFTIISVIGKIFDVQIKSSFILKSFGCIMKLNLVATRLTRLGKILPFGLLIKSLDEFLRKIVPKKCRHFGLFF